MADLFDGKTLPASLLVKVTPRARMEQIRQEVRADGVTLYRVHVTAAPEDGKANAAVIRLLAKALGVAGSRLTIVRGEHAREKVIRIDG